MLINTVLLFLHNALPTFIIATLLLVNLPAKTIEAINTRLLILGLLSTIIAAYLLSINLESLSQRIDGKGVELFLSFGHILIYCSIAILFMLNNARRDLAIKSQLALIIFFILTCINGAHFIIYLTHYWEQVQQVESMILGIILGGGICLSISILFYFLLIHADQKIYLKTSRYFLLFFALGQLMQAVVLLQQVDIISSSQPVWDSGKLIAENSEIGQLLTVLFGYESTPSLLQVLLYAIALMIPVILSKSPFISKLQREEKL